MLVFLLPSRSIDRLQNLPEAPGLYYITVCWNVLYVGKARNLRLRLRRGHHRYNQFKLLAPFGRLHFRVVALVELTAREKSEIARLRPPWNFAPVPDAWGLLRLLLVVWGRAFLYALLLGFGIGLGIYAFTSR